MNVVDSSAWLEYFANGPNAPVFAPTMPEPAQLNVTFCVVELAVTLVCVTEHVSEPFATAVTFGGVSVRMTTACAVFVQPLAGLVAVTVYVPV